MGQLEDEREDLRNHPDANVRRKYWLSRPPSERIEEVNRLSRMRHGNVRRVAKVVSVMRQIDND